MNINDRMVLYKYFPGAGPMWEQKLNWFCDRCVLVTPPLYLNDPSEMFYCQKPTSADDCSKKPAELETNGERSRSVVNFHFEQVNKDRPDFAYEARRKQELVSEQMGVVSLTKNPLSRVMWAHYAAGHTGYVVGFKHKYCGLIKIGQIAYESAWGPFGIAIKVQYTDVLPALSSNSGNTVRVFCTKHQEWSCEEEWRVIGYYDQEFMHDIRSLSGNPVIVKEAPCEDGNTYYQFTFHPEELHSIILGARCHPDLAGKLRTFLGNIPCGREIMRQVKYDPVRRDISEVNCG